MAFTLGAVALAWNAAAIRKYFEHEPLLELSPPPAEDAFQAPPHYVRAMEALKRKEIRPGMSVADLFAISAPDRLETIGPFVECTFTGFVGYQHLTVIAKNDGLVRAIDSGCTYDNLFFDEMTPEDNAEYERALNHVYLSELDQGTQ